MILYYSSEYGKIPVWICPYVKASRLENISKMLTQGLIYCNLDKGAKHGFKELTSEYILRLLHEATENTVDAKHYWKTRT